MAILLLLFFLFLRHLYLFLVLLCCYIFIIASCFLFVNPKMCKNISGVIRVCVFGQFCTVTVTVIAG